MKETLFYNGNIYTMNTKQPKVEAVLIRDEKIIYAGDKIGADKLITNETELYDLNGRMLMPGFTDSHCHPFLAAFWGSGLLLNIEMDREQVLAAVEEHIKQNPDKENYFGIGYPEPIYDEKGPHKWYLDRICSDKPIFILGSSGHEGWCNTKTLEILNITKDTPDPLPGFQFFERDADGNPTGHIVESGATKIIMDGIQWFAPDIVKKSFEGVFDNYSRMGVTSLVDCGTLEGMDETAIAYISEYEDADKLKQRVCSCVMVEDRSRIDGAVELLKKRNAEHHSDKYFINTLKIINDGTIETRTASLFEPYDEEGSDMVTPMISGKELQDFCVKAAAEGFDIHIHGIGNRTVHETLMVGKAVREAGFDDTRIINAHTDYVRPEDDHLFGKYNVIVNTTGVWHFDSPLILKIIGDRANRRFRMQSIIKGGGIMSLGSDMPLDGIGVEPLKSIQMGVTRQMYTNPDDPILQPESEKLSVQQCLEGYTINAAYQMHMEDKIGSLEPGKYADLVILNKDIFKVNPKEIYKVPVDLTMMNGSVTYKREL